ncbi:ABC transporter ATP-binding protein [Cellulomonas sp. 179-A 4D5 NHS]|uniref:ABC transporter ATP-binding protein n=1 Tax=Cellulomonas sp. 179-A 4D5 NHS TaxID=3142378 RepID=UPI0039A34B90
MAAISVDGLRKEYGDTVAVDGLSFTVDDGEVVALLGPNGAGKTTTVEILEGHRSRTRGEVRVLGFDPATGGREMRERVGIVLQDAGFDELFTVAETVRLFSRMYPRGLDADDVIDRVGLTDARDRRIRTLSGGQRRRLDLALGLAGDPQLLFLDEPTTGFDPAARRRAWDLVEELRAGGTTVLLTTHYMDEAEHLADRVAVLVHGRLAALGTPSELGAGGSPTVSFRLPPEHPASDLPPLDGPLVATGLDWQIATAHPTGVLHTLTGWALDRGVELAALSVRQASLEDVYLDLVGTPHDDPLQLAASPGSHGEVVR